MFTQEFKKFRDLVSKKFKSMSDDELFVVGSGDELWNVYLSSFPEGTNPVFRVRAYHDCTADRNFIKNIGRIVSIKDSSYDTVWAVEGIPYPYNVVASAMIEWLSTQEIERVFRTKEPKYGMNQSRAMLDGAMHSFDHFVGEVDRKFQTYKADEYCGKINTSIGVFKRGLNEITDDAISTVLDLINENSIYRGQEFKVSVEEFKKLKQGYRKTNRPDLFIWQNVNHRAALLKNTVIGTLLVDLSTGVSLDKAVASFESKVAPTNYKRPKALVTPRMIEEALKTIRDEGLETALQRRFAVLSDVSVNDILWVDNSVAPLMRDGLKDLLMTEAKVTAPSTDKAIPISIDDFMTNIVPKSTSMEVLVSNAHQGNFVSITAPVHSDVKPLFTWDNNFGWSYDGNITDSIKEKVKRAGGNVHAKLRVSLSWFNTDDLDIHAHDPRGNHIYFGNRAGVLDVDMNVMNPVKDPVENLSWTSVTDGDYRIVVNNYNRRNSSDQGFVLEVECNGSVSQFSYDTSSVSRKDCLIIAMKNGSISNIKMGSGLAGSSVSQDKWGLKTESFAKVQTVMFSPNYWSDNQQGNKHWFFILEGCKNPEPTRGIYNEFLNSNLQKHRKVLELLGDKTKCPVSEEQLSGLGFSSTKKDSVILKANNRLYNVSF